MRDVKVICNDCGRVCLDGEYLVIEAVAGSPTLLASFGERRDLCPECVDAHNNLGRQRRDEDADERPVRRRVGA